MLQEIIPTKEYLINDMVIPDGFDEVDHFIYKVYFKNEMVGLIDYQLGYRFSMIHDDKCLWIGLFLVDESYQRKGFGKEILNKVVKKYGDFYVVNVKISLDNCDRISASKGSVYGHLFISGFNKAYKGSIYVDDVTLTVDKKSVVKQNYENGKNSGCWYYLNRSEKEYTPAVVSFSGKTLDVTKTSLTIKKGKKATIKATAMPKTKITYQSKNKKVATVNSKGVVRGIRKGKTTILVTANGKTVKVQITVK